MPTARMLPLEVVLHTITLLDPDTDRDSLLSLLRVSRACWEAAARALYRTMRLSTARQFLTLFSSASNKERAREYFNLVHRLEFGRGMPFDEEHRSFLWSWAVPGVPLFPNVRQFLFHVKVDRDWNPMPPPEDTYIFHHLDEVCLHDHLAFSCPAQLLPSLDKRPVRSVTIHCNLFYGGMNVLWPNGQAYQVYERQFCAAKGLFGWSGYFRHTRKASEWDVPLKLSLLATASEARDFVRYLDNSGGCMKTDRVEFELGRTATTSPCTLCGE